MRFWKGETEPTEAVGLSGRHSIHIHLPKGAIPKDGPSAGLAISSSLISLALNKPLNQGFAMTGTISIKGKVGIIGGVKEKILGGKRAGISNFIFSEENRENVEHLEEHITEGTTIHFVEDYAQAHALLFAAD